MSAIIKLVENILVNLDKGQNLNGVLMELSKAFWKSTIRSLIIVLNR